MAHTYSEKALTFFKNKNYLKGEETLQERIDSITNVVRKYEKDYSKGLADRIKEYIEQKILIPSTPQWGNLGREKEKGSTPLPASCYILGVQNSIQEIFYSFGETAMMSKLGGGIGANYRQVAQKGTLLSEGFYSNSKLDWMSMGVSASQKVSQNALRRGYSTPEISIEDNDFYELLERLDKKNSDKNDPLIKNNACIYLPIGFWERLPKEKELQKRWLLLNQKRKSKGKIYIQDGSNCNINQSPVYQILDLEVDSTNICTEALSVSSLKDYSFVCMLASLNLSKWDIIKEDLQIIRDCFMFLDINISIYIDLTEGIPFLEKARRSAIDKRDIGLGTLGLHDLFQSKGLAFGDLGSRLLNKEIYSIIREQADIYAKEIGEKLGSPKLCKDAGLTRRNVSLMMIAPNKSTASFADTSEGVQPRVSNYMAEELAGIANIFKNNHLEKLLDDKRQNTFEVWESIRKNQGSVQHLDFLTPKEKEVFRTAVEISPKDIIDLAHDRQKYLDMSQSINLWNRENYTLQDVLDIHKYALAGENNTVNINGLETPCKNLKTLYYFFPSGHAALEKGSSASWGECVSCAD